MSLSRRLSVLTVVLVGAMSLVWAAPAVAKPVVGDSLPASGLHTNAATLVVSANVSDPVGVDKVRFVIERGDLPPLAFEDTTDSAAGVTTYYWHEFDISGLPDGQYNAYVRAYDVYGSSTRLDPVPVITIDRSGPVLSVGGPADGAVVPPQVALSFGVTDATAPTVVTCSWDGAPPARCDAGGSSALLGQSELSLGPHTFTISATDGLGNLTTITRTLNVSNDAPPGAGGAVPAPATTPSSTGKSRCKVPSVVGLTLTKAGAKLEKANCSPGFVKRMKGSKGKKLVVRKQSRKPGATGVYNTRVSLTLGPKVKT